MPGEKSKTAPIMDVAGSTHEADYGFIGEQSSSLDPNDIRDKTVDFLQQQINDILDLVDKKFIDGELNKVDPEIASLHRIYSQLGAAQDSFQKSFGAATNKAVQMGDIKPISAQEYVAHQPAAVRGL